MHELVEDVTAGCSGFSGSCVRHSVRHKQLERVEIACCAAHFAWVPSADVPTD